MHTSNGKDKPIWIAENTGVFTLASARQFFRKKRQKNWINTMNWQKAVPFKMRFLVWRALRDRVPTDAKVSKMGIPIQTACPCCNFQTLESVDPLFSTGKFASDVWRTVVCPFGIACFNMPFKQVMINWWKSDNSNPVQTFLARCLPIIATWEIWKARCSSKYDKVKPNVNRTLNLISFSMAQLVNHMFQKINVEHRWDIVGVSMCGGGGSVRNSSASALSYGLKWCIANGFTHIKAKSDSKLLVNCVNGVNVGPWRIAKEVQELNYAMRQVNVSLSHCFRESNQVADKLASLSHNFSETKEYQNFAALPAEVKGLLNTDRWSLPVFRISNKKKHNITFKPHRSYVHSDS
ncbi:uncharacterized protein LOC132062277 [Lycium ferocissimum]|uniref:uncharacterized protein LOC132062277 n=1 Tax=Lycium ferocissimum TaxID=112874 RepID=UPI002815624F|nr:uncharacterized protein LOC132062277 [Lycium ferocissimum]